MNDPDTCTHEEVERADDHAASGTCADCGKPVHKEYDPDDGYYWARDD